MHDGYMKLGSLAKNQLLFHAWLNDNIILGDKQLNWRQAKYLFTIQKHLKLKVNCTLVRVTDFAFSICEVLRVSFKHCKDMIPKKNCAHLSMLVT